MTILHQAGVCLLALFFALPVSAAVTLTVSVSPTSGIVRLGSTLSFKATVNSTTNPTVTWHVNDVLGGNATLGTITTTGIYTAPAAFPGVAVTIKATSKQDPTKSATAKVTLHNPLPVISGALPTRANTDLTFDLVVTGSKIATGARIVADGTILPTTISGNELRAKYKTATAPGGKISVWLRNPDPGAADSAGKREILVTPPITVAISPTTKTIRGGDTLQLRASLTDAANKTIRWSVNGVIGGNATVGTIDENGLYTAPWWVPAPNEVKIRATSDQDTRAAATADVTLLNALPVITSTNPGVLKSGPSSVGVVGKGLARWAVLTVDGADVVTTWLSPTEARASPILKPGLGGYVVLRVRNPDPGGSVSPPFLAKIDPPGTALSYADASRFLESASWGPVPDSIARAMALGKQGWLNEQMQIAASVWDDPPIPTQTTRDVQRIFFRNALFGNDQLRQRAAFALSQIFVVSGIDLKEYWQLVPYIRLLNQHAFGNYRDVMREMAMSPSMGEYLDMVNSEKPDPVTGRGPNENWARELLQLFTIGLDELNLDGTRKLNNGQAIPAYTEADVAQLSLAFTGWTYPATPGTPSKWKNPRYYTGRMVAFNTHHDQTEKNFLGSRLNAGQTAAQDLEGALDIIFQHPNVGPFVSYRLIQRFVTGNPSPGYVARVASVFNNNGSGVRGDLKAVYAAILTDPEADALASNQGQLREPVLLAMTLLRALGATPNGLPALDTATELMGQDVLHSPSVFNYFSPMFRIPMLGVAAPEFQILNPSTSLARINFVHRVLNGRYGSSVNWAAAHFETLAADPEALLDAVGRALLRGQVQADMKAAILPVLQSTTDLRLRARTAIYLVATSSRFQVKR
jgi:uncharacterized protein (DUF1800 family)